MELRETNETVELDESVLEKIEELPDAPNARWTPAVDAILLQYWPVKQKAKLADYLGIPAASCEHRYKKLVKERDG